MNKLKRVIYNIARLSAKKYLTGNLGKVIEDEEKITCYVKRNKIKKKNFAYTIHCCGIGKKQKNMAKEYKLDKPICYVFDNIELNHRAYIFGYNNCEVIIKNCNFGLGLYISINGKCTLDSTNIATFSYLTIGANELVIKNMDSDKIKVIGSELSFIMVGDNRIDIINSNIGDKNTNISLLSTNELNIVNSSITGKNVECRSEAINVDKKSSLIATDKVNLKTGDFKPINIKAPTIIFNSNLIETEKESIVLKQVTKPLEVKRLKLVNLLKEIKSECEEKLSIQPISKVLKK